MKETFKEFMDIMKFTGGLSKIALSLNIVKHLTPQLQYKLTSILLHMKALIENDTDTYGSLTVVDLIDFLANTEPLERIKNDGEWQQRILAGVLGLPVMEFYVLEEENVESDEEENSEVIEEEECDSVS